MWLIQGMEMAVPPEVHSNPHVLLHPSPQATSWHKYLHPSHVPCHNTTLATWLAAQPKAPNYDHIVGTMAPTVLHAYSATPAMHKLRHLYKEYETIVIRVRNYTPVASLYAGCMRHHAHQWLYFVGAAITGHPIVDDFVRNRPWADYTCLPAGW